jgi:prepilin-type N-terminal cleavage/methylation domain-containing protein
VIALLRRLRSERGYSLIEMLTVITIMGVIMAGLTTVFVGASQAELDMNRRFEAQQQARVALDKLRREIHCSKSATTAPSTGAAPLVTLTVAGQCPTAVSGVDTSVSWCSVSVSASRWAVYRKVGASCDSSGALWADHLTQADLFQYQASSSTNLARLRVVLPVDIKPGDATPAYTLCDQIVLRNSTRSGSGGTALPAC